MEDQVNTEPCPGVIEVGLADIETVGADEGGGGGVVPVRVVNV